VGILNKSLNKSLVKSLVKSLNKPLLKTLFWIPPYLPYTPHEKVVHYERIGVSVPWDNKVIKKAFSKVFSKVFIKGLFIGYPPVVNNVKYWDEVDSREYLTGTRQLKACECLSGLSSKRG